jgi:hypothetical protein
MAFVPDKDSTKDEDRHRQDQGPKADEEKLSRLSWEFDLRSSNRARLYATASCLSRTPVNALSSTGN